MNVRELVTILKFKTDSQSVKSAENTINKIKGMMAKIQPATLKVNTGNLGVAQKSVSSLANSVSRLNGRNISIKTNTNALTNATNKVKALSSEVTKAKKTVTINANVGGAIRQIQGLNAQVQKASKTVVVNAKADTTTATKNLRTLNAQLQKTSKTVTVKANTNALTTATKRVQTLQGAVAKLNGRSVNIRTNTGGLTNLQRKVNDIKKRIDVLNRARVRAIKIGADTSGIDKAIRKLKELDRMQTRTTQNYFRTKAQNIPTKTPKEKTPNAMGGGMGIVGGLKGMFVALGGMAILNEIKQTADAMMSLSSRIKIVTKDEAERLKIEQALYQMSNRNRSSLEDLGDLYYKTALASKRFGASQEDVLKLTDIVSKSLVIGGADVNQQKATILQLSQALGSGVLQGDELRSLRENAPILMDAIATFFNTDVGGLKEMGAKGLLTTEKLMQAILSSGDAVNSKFAQITPTIGQAMTVLGNKFSKLILDIQNSTGIFGSIAGLILQGVDLIGQAIDWVVKEFGTATPEMMGMLQDFKNLWQSLQPLVSALGTIFMNWVVPAMKMFGRVASAVLGAVAQLLQPIADLLGRIAGLIASASNGFSGLIAKAESGAIERYNNIKMSQNNTFNLASETQLQPAMASTSEFFPDD